MPSYETTTVQAPILELPRSKMQASISVVSYLRVVLIDLFTFFVNHLTCVRLRPKISGNVRFGDRAVHSEFICVSPTIEYKLNMSVVCREKEPPVERMATAALAICRCYANEARPDSLETTGRNFY